MPRYWTSLIAALVVVGVAGCSDDSTPETTCDPDQLYDQVNEACVPRTGLSEPDSGGGDTARDAGDSGHNTEGDATSDAGRDVEGSGDDGGSDASDTADGEDAIDMEECDKDRDGALAESCGGYDCDDEDPARSPYNPEICDHIDNSCSGVINDNVTCTFYAHSGEELYEVDPFAKEATSVGGELPWLQDIDTHPDGTLFGVTSDGIYRFDSWAAPGDSQWVLQGDFGPTDIEDPNGLAIDSDGTAFVTSQDEMYTVDLSDGRATWLGETGDFYSSGDCVVDKYDILFMTSKEDGQSDQLVQVSRQDGEGAAIGETGFENIFALTAAWGSLYGLTSNGELIEIDQNSGAASLVHTFDDISFWGAASTPNR